MSSERFSTLSFLAGQKRAVPPKQVEPSLISNTEFIQLCDDIRQYLSHPEEINTSTRSHYNEQITAAVLGFVESRAFVMSLIEDRLAKQHITLPPKAYAPYTKLNEAIFSEVIGLNILEVVMKEYEQLEEIQVVGAQIFVVISGMVRRTSYQFQSVKEVERIQQNLVLYNNDVINYHKRWAEVMLQSGARVTLTGFGFTSVPTLTIRFFTVRHIGLEQLAYQPYEMMPLLVLDWLKQMVKQRKNIVIIGKTNSGKTNLLKALISETNETERIVTIESRLEMMLKRDFPSRNIVEFEVGDDEKHDAGQALKLALRQSPERIIHAEIRDDDANIYVRACTRGHQGSMTTVHANHLEDVPDTIVDMCMLDKRGLDSNRMLKRVTEYVAQVGIQLAIYEGKRVISRIVFYKWEDSMVKLIEVVSYQTGQRGWTTNEQLFQHYIKL